MKHFLAASAVAFLACGQFASAAPPAQPSPRPFARVVPVPRLSPRPHVRAAISPVPVIPKGERLHVKARGGAELKADVTIAPKVKAFTEKDTTFFRLEPKGPGKLALQFHTKDPELELNVGTRLTIQLSTDEPMELEPDLITQTTWPKGAKEMVVAYKGAVPAEGQHIVGAASYTACNSKTKSCKRKVSRFYIDVKN